VRILIVSNLYPPVAVGGYEKRCAHTVQWLARSHEVLVLTSRRGRGAVESQSGRGAVEAESGRGALESHPGRSAAGSDERPGSHPRERVLRELPFLEHSVGGSLRAPLASLKAARTMRRVLREYRPDLVFVWNAAQIPRAIVPIAAEAGCDLALSVADPWLSAFVEGDQFLRHLAGSDRGPRRLWAAVLRLVNQLPALRIDLTRTAAVAIAWNSEALREMSTVPPCLTPVLERVIYPASRNEELFAGVPRAPSPTPLIAYVGRLEPEKAPDVACRAVALLDERHGIEARLVLAGTGDPRELAALGQLADELGIADRVEFAGSLEAGEVAGLLARSHALVVPSRWQEPFGLVALEGALARVPVVASLSGGMPEMLLAEEEALFFAIDDVEACAAELACTLEDPVATAERVRRAFARARGYSLERYRADYDAFVEDALGACSRTARGASTPVDAGGSTHAGAAPM
jgi:glycosyltransferase involved in cell wall biosynthesis